MAYKTYAEQISEHLNYLQSHGLDISELNVNSGWIRCHPLGISNGRGELAYISTTEKLNNGLLGIKTSFRSLNGAGKFSTYGQWPKENEQSFSVPNHSLPLEKKDNQELQEQAARKAYGFWVHSNPQGKSEYLERKGVGHYGIRFRSCEQYGNVAVVPMFDIDGRLWSYQLLNPDGTKRHPKGCRTEGLFHKLNEPINGKPIGIAESYVTAATCLELSDIPTVCAFNSENLVDVSKSIRLLFPGSPIIIFADNDRHLEEKGFSNKGRLKALQACETIGAGAVAVPLFCAPPSKNASDWNDLVRIHGIREAKDQVLKYFTDIIA